MVVDGKEGKPSSGPQLPFKLFTMDSQRPYDLLDRHAQNPNGSYRRGSHSHTRESDLLLAAQIGFLHSNDHHPHVTLVPPSVFTMIKVRLAARKACLCL